MGKNLDLQDAVFAVKQLTRKYEGDEPTLIAEISKLYGDFPSIEMLEQIVAFYKWKRDELINQVIPDLLREAGVSSCTLDSGDKISLETFYAVQIPENADGEKDYSKLVAWLEKNDYDGIIKDQLLFQKGTLGQSEIEELKALGLEFDRKSTIHPMSLKKVIKDHLELGGEYPPEEAALVTIFTRAKIK